MNQVFALIFFLLPIGLCSQIPLFQTGNNTITSLAVSPNGRTVAVEGDAGDITLWDLGSRKKTMTLKRQKAAAKEEEEEEEEEEDDDDDEMPDMSAIFAIGSGSTSRMRFTPDGQKLILTHSNGAIIWNIKEEKQLYEIKAAGDFYDIEAEAQYLAVVKEALKGGQDWEGADIRGSENRPRETNIILYDIQSGSERALTVEALSKVKRIRFVPGSSDILIVGLKGNLSQIDYISGKTTEMKPIYEEDEEFSAVGYETDMLPIMFPVATIAMHPSAKIVAVSNSANKIHIYDVKAEKIKSTIQIGKTMTMPGQGLEHLQFAPNGKYLFGTYRYFADKGLKKQLRFWDIETGKEVKSMVIDPVLSGFSFSADGKYFALTQMDSSKKPPSVICIFDAHNLAEFEPFQGRGIPAFFPNDPKRMVFSLANGIGVHTLKQ